MLKKQLTRLTVLGSSVWALLFLLWVLDGMAHSAQTAVPQDVNDFGYGFNVALWEEDRIQAVGFNWIKLFDPPGRRLPLHVLYRAPANASHLQDVDAFANQLGQIAQSQKGYIDAYEIGNEPNLDATYGWGYDNTKAPPNAQEYVTLLCAAYQRIKAADPDAIVVSAGLAPTGRVPETWQGHPGHNGMFQDERAFFQEFIAAGGGDCLDVVGYHPYGYRARFDAEPDVKTADPDTSCENGFCFRGAEKLYALMAANGLGDKKMWATEFGWITQPPDACLASADWQSRAWQIVSEQAQADNLVGAYQYATQNWPWMGAMFVFNLNFNTAPWITDQCEQMRFYGVVNRPAEAALTAMPKVTTPASGELQLTPPSVTRVITTGQRPLTQTAVLTLRNTRLQPVSYTVTAASGTPLSLTLHGSPTGTLDVLAQTTLAVQFTPPVTTTGVYTGMVAVTAVSGALTETQTIPFTVTIWETINRLYLPTVQK